MSPARKLFNRPIHTNLPSAKQQSKPSTTTAAIETETQNRLSTLKPEDTVGIRTDEEKLGIRKDQLLQQMTDFARTTS